MKVILLPKHSTISKSFLCNKFSNSNIIKKEESIIFYDYGKKKTIDFMKNEDKDIKTNT